MRTTHLGQIGTLAWPRSTPMDGVTVKDRHGEPYRCLKGFLIPKPVRALDQNKPESESTYQEPRSTRQFTLRIDMSIQTEQANEREYKNPLQGCKLQPRRISCQLITLQVRPALQTFPCLCRRLLHERFNALASQGKARYRSYTTHYRLEKIRLLCATRICNPTTACRHPAEQHQAVSELLLPVQPKSSSTETRSDSACSFARTLFDV